MKGPETRLRKRIVKKLEEAFVGAYIRKIHGNAFQNIGVPDLLCCVKGLFFGLEIKRPGNKATAAQLIEGKKINRARGCFAVVTSPDEAVEIVRDRLREKK